jgi:PAS domain S-box-containing protein
MSSDMPVQQRSSSRRKYPLRLFAVTFLVGLLTAVFSAWQTWQVHNRIIGLADKHVHITENIGRIMLFDEGLTMSAHMAAEMGDFNYEKRYNVLDLQLTKAMNELRAMLPEAEIRAWINKTDEAKHALVKMEHQAFALTREGRQREAMALLESAEYKRLKNSYADGMKNTTAAAAKAMEKDYRNFHSLTHYAAAASAAGVLLLLATWFFSIRSARSWTREQQELDYALRKARDDLEIQVQQRTAALLGANEQLEHENSIRKHIELTLQESEQKYRKITESANDAIVTAAGAGAGGGRILGWNTAAERMFGYTESEIRGQPLTMLMPERFHDLHRKGMERVMGGGASQVMGKTVEFAGLRKDGSEFPLELSLAQWEAGGEMFFTAIIRDITERKRAQDALNVSEARFRNLVETTSDWIWEVDENSVYTYVSPKIRDILGYEPAETIGKTPFDLMPPDEAKRVADVFAPIVAAKAPLINIVNTNLHKDGHPVVLETSGVPIIDTEGRFFGYRGIDRDISERKQIDDVRIFLTESAYLRSSEEFFRSLVKFLAETLAMDFVHIDRLEDDRLSARTVAIYFDGAFEDNVTYELKGTPCADLVAKKVCCFTHGVRRLFPKFSLLQDMQAESYAGTTLLGFDGKPIGLLSITGRTPMKHPQWTEMLLQMVAPRAAAELERQKSIA